MRFEVRKVESIKSGDEVLGSRTKVKIVKNKVAPPFRQAEFDIMYGKGISKAGDLLDCAAEAKIIEKSGSWYSFEGNRIGQGRENAKAFLTENPEVFDKIEKIMLEIVKPKAIVADEDGVVIE
jgi:recombination protein RecA